LDGTTNFVHGHFFFCVSIVSHARVSRLRALSWLLRWQPIGSAGKGAARFATASRAA